MQITVELNGKKIKEEVAADETLYHFLRRHGCMSVKCACETANCGLCTVLFNEKPVLSCSLLAVRTDGGSVVTLEGVQKEAEEFGLFLAKEGAEQCGFCNPGLIMNVLAMSRELDSPSEEEIREYLAGNLCRCSGFVGQERSIRKYLDWKKKGEA